MVGVNLWRLQESKGKLVNVFKVKQDVMENTVFTIGKLTAKENIMISALVSGHVTELFSKSGYEVVSGQILARLNNYEIVNDLNLAYGDVEIKKCQVEKTLISLDEIASKIKVAEGKYRRYKAAYEVGGISAEKLEEVGSLIEENKRSYQVAQKEYELNQAQVLQALLQLKNAKQRLEDTVIVSPISAEIFSLEIKEGDYVNKGALLATLGNRNSMEVIAEVNEIDSGNLRIGTEARIKVPAISEENFIGKIIKIAPIANVKLQDNTSQNVVEVIVALNSNRNLKPGYSADITFIVANNQNALIIPHEAILNTAQRKEVWIIKEGKAIKKKIQTGLTNELYAEVVEGISLGEQVILNVDEDLIEGKHVVARVGNSEI